MAKKKGGLGKGLDVLIRNKPSTKKSITNDIEKKEDIPISDNGDNSISESNNDIQNGINYSDVPENNSKNEPISEPDKKDDNTPVSTVAGQETQSEGEIFETHEGESAAELPESDSIETDNKEIYENSIETEPEVNDNIESTIGSEVYTGSDVLSERSDIEMDEGTSIPDKTGEGEKVLIMKISAVEPNREQPRKNFREEGIEELASSIAQYGIIQPLLVQKRDDYYEIIAGERRWRAAMKAGLKEVPVIVKDYTNREAVEISLIENIQREDLNPIEEALAYERLITEFEMTQEEVAGRVSKSRSAVTNSLRLLRFEGDIRQMIIQGDISEGHARTLLGLPNEEMQKLLADRIIKDKLSVRDTEKLVKKLTSTKPKKAKEKDFQKEAILNNLSEQLKNVFGTKVSIIEKARSKGKIEIEYYSDDELNRIFEMLQSLR